MYKWSEIIDNPKILYDVKSTVYLLLECDCCGSENKQMVKYLRKHLKEGYVNKFCSSSCSNIFRTKRDLNCSNCDKPLQKGQKKYCSSSCSATKTNPLRQKYKNCKNCDKIYKGKHISKYCSRNCQQLYKNKIKIENWLSGNDCGYTGKNIALKDFIKRYLFNTRGTSCSNCGYDTKHPSDGRTINEIDHIDGDAKNNHPDNLRILCPNCHALSHRHLGLETKIHLELDNT